MEENVEEAADGSGDVRGSLRVAASGLAAGATFTVTIGGAPVATVVPAQCAPAGDTDKGTGSCEPDPCPCTDADSCDGDQNESGDDGKTKSGGKGEAADDEKKADGATGRAAGR